MRGRPWLQHDFFVSYTRRDADAPGYAIRLANRLRERHDVFLDEDGLEAGMRIEELERKVRRSAVLIVLASPSIAGSQYVPREVRAAQESGRRIVAVDLGRTLVARRAGAALQPVLDALSWIDEPSGLDGGPSPGVVERAVASLSGLRRSTARTLRAALAAAALVALLAYLVSVLQGRAAQRELASERAELAAGQSYARQLAVASSYAARNPTRAAAVLDDVSACPPERRELAWAILRRSCELLRWRAPTEWGPTASARWLSAGELVVGADDGRVRVVDLQAPEGARELDLGARRWLLDVDPAGRVLALARAEDGALELRAADGALQLELPAPPPPDSGGEGREPPRGRFFDGGRTLALIEPKRASFFSAADGSRLGDLERLAAGVIEQRNDDETTRLVDIVSPSGALDDAVFVCNTQVEEYVESSLRAMADGPPVILDHTGGTWSLAATAAPNGRLAVLTEHRDMAVGMGGVGFLRTALRGELLARASADRRSQPRNALSRVDVAGEDATAVAVTADGLHAFVGCHSGALCRVRLDSRALELSLDASAAAVVDVQVAPDGGAILLRDAEGALQVWSTSAAAADRSASLDTLGSALSRRLRTLTRAPSGHVLYVSQALNRDGGGDTQVFDPRRGSWTEITSFAAPFYGGFSHPRVRAAGIRSEADLFRLRPILPPPAAALVDEGRQVFLRELDGRGVEHQRLLDGEEPVERRLFADEDAYVGDLACHPSGELIALARRRASENDDWEPFDPTESAESDPALAASWRLDVYRTDTGARSATLAEGAGRPAALAWSPLGTWIAASFPDGRVRVWRAERPEQPACERTTDPSGRVVALAFDAREQAVAALAESEAAGSTLTWLALPTGAVLGEARFEGALPTRLALRADGLAAAVGFRNGDLALVERETERVRRFAGDAGTSIAALEYSDDGRTLLRVSVASDGWGASTLCDGATGQPLLDLEADGVAMDTATFLPGGSGVLAVGTDDRVYMFRAQSVPGEPGR